MGLNLHYSEPIWRRPCFPGTLFPCVQKKRRVWEDFTTRRNFFCTGVYFLPFHVSLSVFIILWETRRAKLHWKDLRLSLLRFMPSGFYLLLFIIIFHHLHLKTTVGYNDVGDTRNYNKKKKKTNDYRNSKDNNCRICLLKSTRFPDRLFVPVLSFTFSFSFKPKARKTKVKERKSRWKTSSFPPWGVC